MALEGCQADELVGHVDDLLAGCVKVDSWAVVAEVRLDHAGAVGNVFLLLYQSLDCLDGYLSGYFNNLEELLHLVSVERCL